jgi:Poxvirus D5 protein-like
MPTTQRSWTATGWSTVFWALALGLAAYSTYINGRYGYEFWGGTDPTSRLIYATGFILVDVAKFTLAAECAKRWMRGQWFCAALMLALVLAFSALSVLANWNVGAQGQAAMVGAVKAKVIVLDDLKTERAALRADLARLGQPEPAAVLHARVQALEHDRFWSSSLGCTNATIEQSRRFCARYRKAVSALAGATRADQLRERIRDLTEQIRGKTSAATVSGTRHGMHQLADRVGMPVEDMAAALMLTLAVAVELAGVVAWSVASGYVTHHPMHVPVGKVQGQGGSKTVTAPQAKTVPPTQSRPRTRRGGPQGSKSACRPTKTVTGTVTGLPANVTRLEPQRHEPQGQLGPPVSGPPNCPSTTAQAALPKLSLGAQVEPALSPEDHVRAFAETRLELSPDVTLAASDVWAAYQAWCGEQGIVGPATRTRFGRTIKAALEFTARKSNGKVIYEGVRLREVPAW